MPARLNRRKWIPSTSAVPKAGATLVRMPPSLANASHGNTRHDSGARTRRPRRRQRRLHRRQRRLHRHQLEQRQPVQHQLHAGNPRYQNSVGTHYGAAGVVTLIEATGPLMPSFSPLRETTHCVGRRSASGPA